MKDGGAGKAVSDEWTVYVSDPSVSSHKRYIVHRKSNFSLKLTTCPTYVWIL